MSTGARRIATDAPIDRASGGIYFPTGEGPGVFGAKIYDHEIEFAIKREPAAFRIVFIFGFDIWDKGFDVKLEDGNDDENEAFNKKVQAELARLHAKRELCRMTILERGYGYSVMAISYEGTEDHSAEYKPTEEESGFKNIVDIRAYGKKSITSVKTEKNEASERYGFPVEYCIKQTGTTRRLHLHWTRAIHCATRLFEHDWQGISALMPVWDDIVTLRNERWSMGQTLFRYGPGFPVLKVIGAKRAQLQQWIDQGYFADLFARAYFVHNEKQEFDFKGAQGRALDPLNYYLPVMESLSMGSSIPLAILRGAQAGALTGSEVNEREYQSLISEEQMLYEDALRQLITAILRQPRMQEKPKEAQAKTAAVPEIPAFKIEWHSALELTEKEKLEVESLRLDVEMKKAQLLQLGKQQTLTGEQSFVVKELPDGSVVVTEVAKRRPSSKEH